jgi:molybdopterin converting factor small subunit
VGGQAAPDAAFLALAQRASTRLTGDGLLKIGVGLFAPLNQLAGVDRLDLELPEPATGSDLIHQLHARFGDRLPPAGRLMLIVNHMYATPESALKDEDQIIVVARIGCCH